MKRLIMYLLRDHIVLRLRAKGWTHQKINTFLDAMALPQIIKVQQLEDREVLTFGDHGTCTRIREAKKERNQISN